MLEITKRFETDEQEGKKALHAGIAARCTVLHNYFHCPPVCTIHRSVSGDAITSNGILKQPAVPNRRPPTVLDKRFRAKLRLGDSLVLESLCARSQSRLRYNVCLLFPRRSRRASWKGNYAD